jgi:hypothetical protein
VIKLKERVHEGGFFWYNGADGEGETPLVLSPSDELKAIHHSPPFGRLGSIKSFVLCGARPKALPLETASFEKLDQTFTARSP